MDSSPLPSRLQLPPGDWATLLDGLCARFPGIDRACWQDRFDRGRVRDTHGAALAAERPWQVGLEIVYFREVPDEVPIPFVERIVHQDGDLLVADKPHFLPVTPAGRHLRETLLARLIVRTGIAELVPLHRIDRGTAGLVLFSLNPQTRSAYQALFRERRIDKCYEALAPALPQLDFPHEHRSCLVPGEPFFRMREGPGEANSLTRLQVVEDCGPLWRYRLEPVTGRKHQLRVHMAALGAPIAGDDFYPELNAVADTDYRNPLQLLARSLAFVDPLNGQRRSFESGFTLG